MKTTSNTDQPTAATVKRTVELPKHIYDIIAQKASDECRSVNGQINMMLLKAVEGDACAVAGR